MHGQPVQSGLSVDQPNGPDGRTNLGTSLPYEGDGSTQRPGQAHGALPMASGGGGNVVSGAALAGVAPVGAASAANGATSTATVLGDAPRAAQTAPNKAAAAPEAARPTPEPPPEAPVDRAHDVLRQIKLRLEGGVREASLSLVPAHLGRLQVKLTIADGKVGAVVRAESPETLELLERHLPELREALAQEGLGSGEFQLSLGLDSEHGAGFESATGLAAGARGDDSSNEAGDARLSNLLHRLAPNRIGDDGVDTYA